MFNSQLTQTVTINGVRVPRGVQDADITRPAEIVVTHDSDPAEVGWTEGNSWDSGKTTDWPHLRPACSASNQGRVVRPCGMESYKAPWFQRHNGTFNVLFYDGHAKSVIAGSQTLTDANFIP